MQTVDRQGDYSPKCVEKLSKKALGGVSSVGIAGMTQRNRPRLPRFGGFLRPSSWR
jgi:hypothetical protein